MLRHQRPAARLATALALALAATPLAARAAPRLVEDELRLERPALALDDAAVARIVLARLQEGGAQEGGPKEGGAGAEEGGGAKEDPAAGSLDFDLLGEAEAPVEPPDAGKMRLRRKMLTWHQASGFALVGLQLTATVLGQLNYNDKFGGSAPPNTGQYQVPHAVAAYATLGAFVATGTLALLAPSPVKKERRFDRVMVHRIAMFTAAAGMAAQAALGIYTSKREGYLDQKNTAQIHLAIGYATLAAVATGVAVLAL